MEQSGYGDSGRDEQSGLNESNPGPRNSASGRQRRVGTVQFSTTTAEIDSPTQPDSAAHARPPSSGENRGGDRANTPTRSILRQSATEEVAESPGQEQLVSINHPPAPSMTSRRSLDGSPGSRVLPARTRHVSTPVSPTSGRSVLAAAPRSVLRLAKASSQDEPGDTNGRHTFTKRSLSLFYPGDDKQSDERQRLLAGLKSTDVYHRRWYILAMAALLAMLEGCIWNTWAPIAGPAKSVFAWTDQDIAQLANWGCIAYCIAAFPLSWVMDAKGLRPAVVIAAFLIMAGAGIRCISIKAGSTANWLINAGHVLNGLSSPVTFGAPPLVSAIWFPPSQRTLATSIGTIASYAGIALSFIVGPQLIPEVPGQHNQSNQSTHCFQNTSDNYSYNNGSNSDDPSFTLQRIKYLLYGEGALAAVLFLCILIYFPSLPPLPPSLSGSGSRLEFIKGLKRLLQKRVFWVVAIVYGLSSGVYSGWSAVLNIILANFCISQSHASWIGFYSTVAGAVGGMAIAALADRYAGKLRQFLIALFFGSALMFTWFAITGLQQIGESMSLAQVSFYISSILGGFFINSTIPLFFEMAVEAAFPISEGIAAVIIMLLNNIFSVLFLVLLMFPKLGSKWTTWVLVAVSALSIPVLAVLRDKYTRSSLDAMSSPPVSPRPSSTEGVLRRSATMAPGKLMKNANKHRLHSNSGKGGVDA